MKKTVYKVLLMVFTVIITLCMLTQGVFASEADEQASQSTQETEVPSETEPEEDNSGIFEAVSGIWEAVTNLPDRILDGLADALTNHAGSLTDAILNSFLEWAYTILLTVAEAISTSITASSANVFSYSWFQVIVGVFRIFGTLLFAVGVVLAFVDVGVEYRRRGADIQGVMLNLGKGLMAVGLFSTVPVPLFNFCVNIQSIIIRTLAINWRFEDVIISIGGLQPVMAVIMLVIMIVLMFLIYLDSLKRGAILLVQICIGSLHMISVPRGYLDNFYGWCKQVIALCITVLLQNLIMFCGFMIVPTNLFLGIGTMFAAKEVPRICAQLGLDTSVKASFTHVAMGANAAVQAVKAASLLFV